MGLAANIRRDIRFAGGLYRLLKRIKPITLDSDVLLCDDIEEAVDKFADHVALEDENRRLTCSDTAPCQLHNNCSGKHAGFLTLNRHLGGEAEYVEVDHPVQKAVRAATEEVAGEASAGYGIDGCSAPNFAGSIGALRLAEMPSPSTRRVSAGSMMPSSHSRAVA